MDKRVKEVDLTWWGVGGSGGAELTFYDLQSVLSGAPKVSKNFLGLEENFWSENVFIENHFGTTSFVGRKYLLKKIF